MSSTPDPTQPAEHPYAAILDTLITQGAAIATRLHATATAATTPDTSLPEAAIAFDRIARCVRRTIALARHLAAPPQPAHNQPAHPQADRTQAGRTQSRIRVIRAVEDTIHARRHDRDAEALAAELRERLDDPHFEHDLQARPIPDLIEDLRRDLGIAAQGRTYTWRRRTPADIARLRAFAATPPGTSIEPAALDTPPSPRPQTRLSG